MTSKVYAGAGTGALRLSSTTTYLGDGGLASVAFNGTGSSPSEGTDTITMTYDAMGIPDQAKRGATVHADNGWNPDDTLVGRADGTVGPDVANALYDFGARAYRSVSGVATR